MVAMDATKLWRPDGSRDGGMFYSQKENGPRLPIIHSPAYCSALSVCSSQSPPPPSR